MTAVISVCIIIMILEFKLCSTTYVRDRNSWTLLHCACERGNKEVVQYLLVRFSVLLFFSVASPILFVLAL